MLSQRDDYLSGDQQSRCITSRSAFSQPNTFSFSKAHRVQRLWHKLLLKHEHHAVTHTGLFRLHHVMPMVLLLTHRQLYRGFIGCAALCVWGSLYMQAS